MSVQDAVPVISSKSIPGTDGPPSRTFFSYAADYFPPESGVRWTSEPQMINADAVAASPDALALISALWDSAFLSTASQLLGRPADAMRAAEMVRSVFAGPDAMLPSMQYARVIPESGLDDFRVNPQGYRALDDIALVLASGAPLPLKPQDTAALAVWSRCALLSRL